MRDLAVVDTLACFNLPLLIYIKANSTKLNNGLNI